MTNSDTSAYTETNKTTNIFPFSNFLKSKIFFWKLQCELLSMVAYKKES